MPLALKNRVKNIASDKNKEKSCTKGKLKIIESEKLNGEWRRVTEI